MARRREVTFQNVSNALRDLEETMKRRALITPAAFNETDFWQRQERIEGQTLRVLSKIYDHLATIEEGSSVVS